MWEFSILWLHDTPTFVMNFHFQSSLCSNLHKVNRWFNFAWTSPRESRQIDQIDDRNYIEQWKNRSSLLFTLFLSNSNHVTRAPDNLSHHFCLFDFLMQILLIFVSYRTMRFVTFLLTVPHRRPKVLHLMRQNMQESRSIKYTKLITYHMNRLNFTSSLHKLSLPFQRILSSPIFYLKK